MTDTVLVGEASAVETWNSGANSSFGPGLMILKATAVASGNATHVFCSFSSNPGQYQAAIYSAAGALLGTSAIQPAGATGDTEIELSSPVSITSGTEYWIGIAHEFSGARVRFASDESAGYSTDEANAAVTLGTLPDPVTTQSVSANTLGVYAFERSAGLLTVSTTNVLQPLADFDFWGTVSGYPPTPPAESMFDDSTLTVVDGDQYAVRIDSGLTNPTLTAAGVLEADATGSLTRWILDASGTGVDGEWYGPGTVTIFQIATLTVANALHGHAAESPVLTTGGAFSLAVNDATHSHSAEVPSLTEAATVVVLDAAHGHTADGVSLTAGDNLVPEDAQHAHLADGVSLTQAGALAVDEAGHGHQADSVALSVAASLAVQGADHGHTASAVDLGFGLFLTVGNALHAHTVDDLVLTQASVLAVQSAQHDHTADSVSLSEAILLVVQGAGHNHTAAAVALSQAAMLSIQEALHGLESDGITLTQDSTLVVSDALHAHLAQNIVLPGTVFQAGRLMVVRGTDRLMVVAPTNYLMVVRH